jgi:hypothetical protein
MTQLLPEDGLRLNPDAAHPPFAWQVSLPDDGSWAMLDTNPTSWQRSAQRLVDERLAGARITMSQRREVLGVIGELVATCQQGGTLLSLVQIGALQSGEFSTAGLHIAWYDSSPDVADLLTVRRATAGHGVVKEHDTPAGRVVMQRATHSSRAPGRDADVRLTSLQAFLPLTNRCWTAVVATSSAHGSLTDSLHAVVLTVAGSIEPLDATGVVEQRSNQPVRPSLSNNRHRMNPTSRSAVLGPMTTHRVNPDRPRTDPQP